VSNLTPGYDETQYALDERIRVIWREYRALQAEHDVFVAEGRAVAAAIRAMSIAHHRDLLNEFWLLRAVPRGGLCTLCWTKNGRHTPPCPQMFDTLEREE
jgi:hypothetical protein